MFGARVSDDPHLSVLPDPLRRAGQRDRGRRTQGALRRLPAQLVPGAAQQRVRRAAPANVPAPPAFGADGARSPGDGAVGAAVDSRPPAQAPAPSWDRSAPALEEPPFRARRNPARLWTIAAIIAAALLIAATVAVNYFGLSNVGRWVGIPVQTGDVLSIVEQNARTSRLERGNAVLEVSGTIVNQTDQVQRVPQILAELKDAQGRIIYSWSIAPPIGELQPGPRRLQQRQCRRAARRPAAQPDLRGDFLSTQARRPN